LFPVDWIRHDLKYSIRRLIRRPGMSTLAILTLAVGLGVNTVAFSAIDALIFKPFHIPNAENIGWVMIDGVNGANVPVTLKTFDAIERHTQTLDLVAASTRSPLADTGQDVTKQVWALIVSPRFFEILPPSLVAGRGLVAGDSRAGLAASEIATVVSERFWRARFDANPDLNALRFELNRRPARIVGVMKEGFQTPTGVFEPDLWITMAGGESLGVVRGDSGLDRSVGFIATPRPGVPATAIAQDLQRIVASEISVPETSVRARYERILDGHPETRALRPVAAAALAAVAIVLLIACFNVAGLLLAQSAERQRELGMRAALGASRPRLIRQLLTDGLVLSILAGGASILLAGWSAGLLSTFSLPAPIPQRLHFVIDWRLMTFAAGLSLVAALVPAVLPALQVWRAELTAWIRSGSGGSGGRSQARARRGFLILQVAGSTVFVIVSAVFAQRFVRARSIDPGFDTTHTAVMELDPAYYGYSPARSRELVTAFSERLAKNPGVVAVSAADRIPFTVGYPTFTKIAADGRDCAGGACPSAGVYATDGRHEAAMGLALKAGRWYDSSSAADRDTAVISQSAAEAAWPGEYPIGHSFRDDAGRARRVIGVVNDITTNLTGGDLSKPRPNVYFPIEDRDFARPVTIVLRAAGAPDAFVETMQRTLHELAPELPPQSVATMRQRLALPLWPARTLAGFFSVCGLLALILATIGLFGVTHYVVSQRTREFGVRLAIGASSSILERMVVSETVRLIAPGILIGLGGGLLLDRLIRAHFTSAESADPLIMMGAVTLEVGMAVIAAWLPARRAGRTNPLEALRAE
jgi:putative ABC transport system permease protein